MAAVLVSALDDRIMTNFVAANMQVITAVYLNCRPDLRDEWLTGIEVDDVADAQVSFML